MSLINLVLGLCIILFIYLCLKFYKSYLKNTKEREDNNGLLKIEIENCKNALDEALNTLEMHRLVAGRFFVSEIFKSIFFDKDPAMLDIKNYLGTYKNIPIFYCPAVDSILIIPQGEGYAHLWFSDFWKSE